MCPIGQIICLFVYSYISIYLLLIIVSSKVLIFEFMSIVQLLSDTVT